MSWLKKIRIWLRQGTCRHEFRMGEQQLTGIPKPPEPAKNASYDVWLKYLSALNKSDWHLKRIRWPCCKCGKVFHAHCGLDIIKHGKIQKRQPDDIL